MKPLRIALLHLRPLAGELEHNRKLIEDYVHRAADAGADWIITPELAVSGLQFSHILGTAWIEPQPDAWLQRLAAQARRQNTALFIGTPERADGRVHNSVIVIGRDGTILGRQHKLNCFIDDWSAGGSGPDPIVVDGVSVGILICADSYEPGPARRLKSLGAQLLVAPSAWGPGMHGPEGEWEARSRETGLPVFVCNRTGADRTVKFWRAESLVIEQGERRLVHTSEDSAMVVVDWQV